MCVCVCTNVFCAQTWSFELSVTVDHFLSLRIFTVLGFKTNGPDVHYCCSFLCTERSLPPDRFDGCTSTYLDTIVWVKVSDMYFWSDQDLFCGTLLGNEHVPILNFLKDVSLPGQIVVRGNLFLSTVVYLFSYLW